MVIVAAAPGLTQARAEQLVRRPVRANWQSHLLTFELDGLDVTELVLTLTEVLHATDLTEACVGARTGRRHHADSGDQARAPTREPRECVFVESFRVTTARAP